MGKYFESRPVYDVGDGVNLTKKGYLTVFLQYFCDWNPEFAFKIY